MEFSLQAPSKQLEGASHPDRDSQFHYINELAEGFLDDAEPVISVDTKKKVRHEVARSERLRRLEARPMPVA